MGLLAAWSAVAVALAIISNSQSDQGFRMGTLAALGFAAADDGFLDRIEAATLHVDES